MAMLAEPRRKQKWTLNPRGKQWSDDSNKFGQKMLEKMGWTSGKGLGVSGQGMTEHVRVKYKDDQAGIGYDKSKQDQLWTETQDSFNELLQKLQSGDDTESNVKTLDMEKDLSGKSLELKSKQSRARVHYRKFTRGKDVNKYSSKDLANIFGKKDLNDAPKIIEDIKKNSVNPEKESSPAPIGTRDTTAGILTIKGGSIADYFKNKMPPNSHLTPKKTLDKETSDRESESECERAGFGFSTSNFACSNPTLSNLSPEDTPKKRKSEFYIDNPIEIPNFPSTPSKKRKIQLATSAFENPALDLTSNEPNSHNNTNKMELKRCEVTPIECIPSVSMENFESPKKMKKKRKNQHEITTNSFEIARNDTAGLANDALDLSDETPGKKRVTFNDVVEYSNDSAKKLKKLDKFEVEIVGKKKKKKSKNFIAFNNDNEIKTFTNEALDIDIINDELCDNALNEERSKKTKKRGIKRSLNLETIIEAPEDDKENDSNMDIITLDDSLNGINENCESLNLSTPKRTKKMKKNKKISDEMLESAEINGVINDNDDDNELTVKKKKKMTKIKIETIDIDEVNVNEVKLNSVETKIKKKKKKNLDVIQESSIDTDYDIDSPTVSSEKRKKSKKILKSLFIKSPIVQFVGTNLHELPGYGVNL